MHRDLNDIIPPSRRRSMDAMGEIRRPEPSAPAPMDMRPPTPTPVVHAEEPMDREPVPPMPVIRRSRFGSGGGRFPYATAIVAVVVVLICGGILFALAGAKVTIVPVANVASIQSDLSATAGTGDLPFQIVTVTKTATANVPAESTLTANDPAQGKITITNSQTKAQALIKNTRFATPAGLVFRIRDSVSIPAGGSITTMVYADTAGDKYNIGPSTFTIPGLQGSSAFNQVTAKSDAPMTGGFSGTRPSVSQATKDKQYADIQSKLTADLTKDLNAKIPQGYILLPGATFTTFTPDNDAAGASGTVTLSEDGSISAVVFPNDALARTIAFKSVGTYGGQPVTIPSGAGLTVKPAQPTLAPDATNFDFNLSGTTTIVWTVDPAKIAAAVAGKSRDASEVALRSFPEVDKATLVLRPFWSSTFPADPAKIKVIVQAPGAAK